MDRWDYPRLPAYLGRARAKSGAAGGRSRRPRYRRALARTLPRRRIPGRGARAGAREPARLSLPTIPRVLGREGKGGAARLLGVRARNRRHQGRRPRALLSRAAALRAVVPAERRRCRCRLLLEGTLGLEPVSEVAAVRSAFFLPELVSPCADRLRCHVQMPQPCAGRAAIDVRAADN